MLVDKYFLGGPVPDEFVCVGVVGGAHSGPESCVMRDWYAQLYRSKETRGRFPVYQFVTVRQRPGDSLAYTRVGTGINAATRPGGAMFGDSAVTTGAARQIVVRDSAR